MRAQTSEVLEEHAHFGGAPFLVEEDIGFRPAGIGFLRKKEIVFDVNGIL